MKHAPRLYDVVLELIRQCPWSDLRHAVVFAWMVIGMIESGRSNLTHWIKSVETGAVYAQSTQRRFSRWMHNARIHPTYLYGPLITWALSEWNDEIIYLSFDPTMLWNRFCVMRLSVVYRGRAIPVIWRVLEHGSSSVKLAVYQDLLKKAAGFMPPGKKVVFLADRGFGDHQLMDYVRYTLRWEFRIRLKPKCLFHAPGLGWKQFQNYALKPGEALLFQQIRLFKRHPVENVNVVFAREATSGELWLIVSSEPVSLQTLQEYGLRFDIEENFLDDKSNGFDWEKSGLRDPLALSRLCLVLAVTTLYLTLQGTAIVETAHRRWVDVHTYRGMSYLKIGWEWVTSYVRKGWTLLTPVPLKTNRDPDPAMASRKQDLARRLRLEFQVFQVKTC
jgi:hypothetical protein